MGFPDQQKSWSVPLVLLFSLGGGVELLLQHEQVYFPCLIHEHIVLTFYFYEKQNDSIYPIT